MKLNEQTEKMVNDFVKHFGEENLPTEKEILDELKSLEKLPDSIEDIYTKIFLRKLKNELQKKYPLKSFVIKNEKISEIIDINITTIRIIINDVEEYINSTESKYDTTEDIIKIMYSHMKETNIDTTLLNVEKLKEEISKRL